MNGLSKACIKNLPSLITTLKILYQIIISCQYQTTRRRLHTILFNSHSFIRSFTTANMVAFLSSLPLPVSLIFHCTVLYWLLQLHWPHLPSPRTTPVQRMSAKPTANNLSLEAAPLMQTAALPAAPATRQLVYALLWPHQSKLARLGVDSSTPMLLPPLPQPRRKSRSKVSKFRIMHGKGGMEFGG
jgi:hypothetical protein